MILHPVSLVLALSLAACGDKGGGGNDSGGDGGNVAGIDQDGDGYDSVETGGDDCDDGNAATHPGATERCDGSDNDCNGEVDEGFDADGDGHFAQDACATTRENGDDCDDGAATVYPGAPETPYDGIDQDCDGSDLADVDGDGADAVAVGGDDCDDGDAAIGPDATETPYDGIDQDCSGADLTDVDGDGYDAVEAGGDDCDDTQASAHPGGVEIAYDGIDQDCDGADLADGDGDGHAALAGGGDDCDDTDAGIYPGAHEIPYDGIDQDCDGNDLTDVDGDGHDSTRAAGDDCDDSDPQVHPGTVDVGGDGVDADCDGTDGGTMSLDSLSPSIYGVTGSQDYLGLAVAICDLDADGYGELLVAAPLANSYHGRIGIFSGASADTWTGGMSLDDADVVIEGDSYFMGFGLGCGDIDGDGFLDLITTRAEISYTTTYTTDFEILVWYGDGTAFAGGSTDAAADAVLRFDLGSVRAAGNLYSRDVSLGDLDGDGKDELVVNMQQGSNADGTLQNGDDTVWIIPGGSYSGTLAMASEVAAKVGVDQGVVIQSALVVPDMDGDGKDDLFVGQAGWDQDYPDSSGSPTYEGLAAFIATPSGTSSTASELAFGSIVGETDDALAYGAAFADLDGDGAPDGLFSSLYDTAGGTGAGGFYTVGDLPGTLADGTGLARGDVADGHVYGETASTYFGGNLFPVGDIDGDGRSEVLAGQQAGTDPGRFYLLDGASLWGDTAVSGASLLRVDGVETTDGTGLVAATGDLDGDGIADLALSAYAASTTSAGRAYTTGRLYLALSRDFVRR